MGASYHQFCPVAKAMELLDERWTLLLVRELLTGSGRFNDLRRGLPRMSPTLLSKRLHQLVRAGVVVKQGGGSDVRYLLSPAGRELRPIVEALGVWGVRWVGELGDVDLDPKLLLWDMRRNVDHAAVPPRRTVIQFRFPEIPLHNDWWLVIANGDVDACDVDPGFAVDATVTAPLRCMVAIWLGDRTWADAVRSGELVLAGPSKTLRTLPAWFRLSQFAAVPRPERPRAAS